MSAIDDLIQALEALKQTHDGTILYAAEVHDLVDGIFAAMEMAGDVTVATTPIEGGNRITITDPEGVAHDFDVMDGTDGQDGAPGHNPCLGVFADQTALETAHSTAEAGDYAYFFKNISGYGLLHVCTINSISPLSFSTLKVL